MTAWYRTAADREKAKSRMTPMHEDPVRRMLMQAVQHYLVTRDRPEMPDKPDVVDSVTGFIVGPSEIRIRVKLDNDTFRTFTVTLRENR